MSRGDTVQQYNRYHLLPRHPLGCQSPPCGYAIIDLLDCRPRFHEAKETAPATQRAEAV
jgi:hypothetical protein